MNENYKIILCTAVKLLRAKHNLSQEKFAEICGMNSDNLRNIEYCRHAPSPQTIDKICNAFNIDIIDLINLTREEIDEHQKITNAIKTLNKTQLALLFDFVSILKKH